ncbi:MAG: tRNA pseudouridine(55) synthase TruB [bacterium]
MIQETLDGAIVVNKSPGFTSTQYVEKIKTIINQKLRRIYRQTQSVGDLVEKAGHTGTLDPNAAGILVILLNKATKIIPYLSKHKTYSCEIILGKETDTLDTSGKVINQVNITPETASQIVKQIENLLPQYIGKFTQYAPSYSAKKIKGIRMYQIAPKLQQQLVQQKSNIVYIYSIKLLDHYFFNNHHRIQLEIECSQGTYVRSIIKDISQKINIPLTLSFLVRKNSNNFTLSQSVTIEEIKQTPNISDLIIPLTTILENFSYVIVNDKTVFKVRNGHSFSNQNIIHLEKKGIYNDKNIFIVKDRRKEILAICQSDDCINFKIRKVLKPY